MIVLCDRAFRRHGDDRWAMLPEHPGFGLITFDATGGTTFEWRLLAAALDQIERANQQATDGGGDGGT